MTRRIATDTLTRALLDLAGRGERTHCSDPTSHYLWLSERDHERATAVMWCDHCPVLTVCREQPNYVMNAGAFGAARTSAADQDLPSG